ncbi:MAG TPA: DUF2298 domain-containing protein [Patescibacteria group bacterium]
MIESLRQITIWWTVFFIIGVIFLPITKRLFDIFLDKGYIFSKLIGIILVTYLIYVLSTLHILPFTIYSLIGVLAVFFVINVLLLKKSDIKIDKTTISIWILEEITFFITLSFWSFVRSYQPNINGLEKFMDFGFVNSILRSTYFPPKDMWMAPLTINYYFFGHLVTAVLTKLSTLSSNITFNLMVATIFAFTFSCGFSLGGNLLYLFKIGKKNLLRFIIAGILSAWLLAFAGNLHTIYTFFTPYQNDNPVAPWQLSFSPTTFPNAYWYPNATRFIYHTIHEFPIYSFVVSDLHGHVLDIPFVLLTLSILLVLFLKPLSKTKYQILKPILVGALCGIMYMTNAWDGLIYLFIGSAFFLYKLYREKLFSSRSAFTYVGSLFASFFVISLPFSLFFKPFASQIGINCAPDFLIHIGHIGPIIFEQGYCQFSPWWQLAILYGFFFFWFVSFTFFHFFKKEKNNNPIDIFVTIVSIFAFLLIIAPEFVYLKDIYTTYFRANTMFKLCYQAYIILSIASAYYILRILPSFSIKQKIKIPFVFIFIILSAILLTLVSVYPYFSINSYYSNFEKFEGLDGTKYLEKTHPGDSQAINWINKNISGQPVMLEAQGDSYTDYERISSNTGLPTVFGWTVHEWLWRGTYDIVPPRIEDVKNLYESTDIQLTKSLIKKYNVSYVYIGDMEREKYKVDEKKFDNLGQVIYQNSSTKIYKIL